MQADVCATYCKQRARHFGTEWIRGRRKVMEMEGERESERKALFGL